MRRPTQIPPRRGIASFIAMLFVVLFAVLALGFYTSVTNSVQISANERNQTEATFAAESGIQFISYQLSQIPSLSSSDPDAIFNSLFTQLSVNLHNTQNMRDAINTGVYDNPTQSETVTERNGDVKTIDIPGTSTVNNKAVFNWMPLGPSAGSCRIIIQLTSSPAKKLTIAAIGRSTDGTAMRALQYDIKSQSSTATVPWVAPNGSIVTYSAINASNGVTISGDVMTLPPTSQSPASVTGGARITGTLSYPANYPSPVVNNGGAIGTVNPTNSFPPMPQFNTSAFAALVPPATQLPLSGSGQSSKTYSGVVLNSSSPIGSGNVFNDIRIKANSNITFNNNTVINGVVYIESPSKVNFSGVTVNGVIVSDNNPSVPYDPATQNSFITINNGSSIKGTGNINMSQIPTSETANINTLKNMFIDSSGNPVNTSMILTPNFGLSFQGGMTVPGASMIVGSQFNIANGSAISLSGLLMNLGSSTFNVAGGMTINKSGLPTSWPGVGGTTVTNTSVIVDHTTYAEVPPINWTSY